MPFSLSEVRSSPSPVSALPVTLSRPSTRRLARIPPATSPTPVTRRADMHQRHRHRRLREAAAPLRPDVLEAGIVEGDPRAGQPVGEGEGPERAVEQGDQPHLLAGHVREHGRRPKQVGADPQVAESASGEVDDAGADDAHRRRAQRQPALRAGGPRASRCRSPGRPARSASLSCPSRIAPARAGRRGCSGRSRRARRRSAVRRPERSSRAMPFHLAQLPSPSTVRAIGRSVPSIAPATPRAGEASLTSRSKRSRSGSASRKSERRSPPSFTAALRLTSARPERMSASPARLRDARAARSPPCRS